MLSSDGDENFESWLSDVVKTFEKLPLKHKYTTLRSLVEHSEPEQRYCLLNEISNNFHYDILVSLPLELQEQVCHYIDPKSLLVACCVSKEWNGIISSLSEVWHRKCNEFGIKPARQEPSSWKHYCVTALKLVEQIATSSAFRHRDISASCLSLDQITGLDYSQGLLVGSGDSMVGIWRVEDCELLLQFHVPYRISCIQLSTDNLLAIGHSTGHITTWAIDMVRGFLVASLHHEFRGHAGVIMSLSVCTKIDIMVSGSTDFTAKIWCISTGRLLKTLSAYTHWVVQVTILPTLCKKNCRTLFSGQHSLLTVTRDHVKIFSWNVDPSDKNMYGDMSVIEDAVIEFPLNNVHRFFTPGYHVSGGNAVYVKQTLVKDEEEGNAEIVFQNLLTQKCVKRVHLERKVRKLLAVGEKFALLLLPHSHYSEFNLLVVELATGNAIGGCHLPHSTSVESLTAYGAKEPDTVDI